VFALLDVDDESNTNQHPDLFIGQKDHEKRLIRLEMTHKHTTEKMAIAGMVLVFLADKLGIWEKLFT
jgi:hypothetical protein